MIQRRGSVSWTHVLHERGKHPQPQSRESLSGHEHCHEVNHSYFGTSASEENQGSSHLSVAPKGKLGHDAVQRDSMLFGSRTTRLAPDSGTRDPPEIFAGASTWLPCRASASEAKWSEGGTGKLRLAQCSTRSCSPLPPCGGLGLSGQQPAPSVRLLLHAPVLSGSAMSTSAVVEHSSCVLLEFRVRWWPFQERLEIFFF